jgi:PTH1 family peptidyl-tRNA hydrolase
LEELFIVIGLGNPGSRFGNTRHNVGFDTIDLLSASHGIAVSKLKHKALSGDGIIHDKRVLLVKPQTFMNLSGESVQELLDWYKIPENNVILVYDDIDLPLGKIRVRPGGSAGTHRGMQSVIYITQTDKFPRVRIGIGKPPEGWDLADFVLSKFSREDRKIIDESVQKAAEAVITIVKSGVDAAMNIYNR